MSKNILKNQIISLLEEIVEQSKTINAYEGQIPQIELDIVMANIRELYTAYHKLNEINNSYTPHADQSNQSNDKDEIKEEEVPLAEQQELSPQEETNKATEKVPPKQEDFQELQQEEKEEIKEEITEEVKKEEGAKDAPKEETIIPKAEVLKEKQGAQPSLGLFAEEKTIGDKFMEENEKASINEKIQKEKTDYSIGARMQESAINDLRSAIGLNEKFLFINELFKGNHDAYHATIDELNALQNKEQAFAVLEKKAAENNWQNNKEIKTKFYHLVERRFE
jgi:hypothetical protein